MPLLTPKFPKGPSLPSLHPQLEVGISSILRSAEPQDGRSLGPCRCLEESPHPARPPSPSGRGSRNVLMGCTGVGAERIVGACLGRSGRWPSDGMVWRSTAPASLWVWGGRSPPEPVPGLGPPAPHPRVGAARRRGQGGGGWWHVGSIVSVSRNTQGLSSASPLTLHISRKK